MSDEQKPIARRLRFEILRRDGHSCRYCGAQAPDVPLTVDHVIPRVLGGSDDPTNLVTACRDCNLGKSSMPADAALVADVDAAAMLFARALERAAEIRAFDRKVMAATIEIFDQTWSRWTFDRDDERQHLPRPGDWRATVERFYELGLSDDDINEKVIVAMRGPARNAEKWRYFCGCCWRELTERQELARRLIEDGQV